MFRVPGLRVWLRRVFGLRIVGFWAQARVRGSAGNSCSFDGGARRGVRVREGNGFFKGFKFNC